MTHVEKMSIGPVGTLPARRAALSLALHCAVQRSQRACLPHHPIAQHGDDGCCGQIAARGLDALPTPSATPPKIQLARMRLRTPVVIEETPIEMMTKLHG